MNKSLGIVLWIAIALSILFFAMLSPTLDSSAWYLVIVGFMLLLWYAWHLTFSGHIHHTIAAFLTLVYVLSYRFARWFHGKIRVTLRLKQLQQRISEPKPIANRSLDVIGVHPKILRGRCKVLVGYNKYERPISVDLSSAHTLIAASTGGGKTTLIVGMLIQLLSKPPSRRPEIYVIDLKGDTEDALFRFGALVEYVSTPEDAVRLLRDLNVLAAKRNKEGGTKKPILLFIDEVADLTTDTESQYRRPAILNLKLLARKARSARIHIVIATQHARYDVLEKHITYNLLRKICFPVDTRAQAEVIFGFKPDFDLPKRPGDFLLKDGIGIKRGHALPVQKGEIDELLAAQFEDFGDRRLKLWRAISVNKKRGASVVGIGKFYRENRELDWVDQNFVKFGYRHLALAGVLNPPEGKGSVSTIKVEFILGIRLVQKYIQEDRWTGQPKVQNQH